MNWFNVVSERFTAYTIYDSGC